MFNVSQILLAINVRDPQERLQRINALAELIEHFSVAPVYNGDSFVGIADALPPVLATEAQA